MDGDGPGETLICNRNEVWFGTTVAVSMNVAYRPNPDTTLFLNKLASRM
jgi:hypothetical protein